jgi:hypothetical protein
VFFKLEITRKKDYDELKIINGSLKKCPSKVRNKMFSTLDKLNVNKTTKNKKKTNKKTNKIINSLKSFEAIHCFEVEDHRRDQIVFTLPLSPLATKIIYYSGGYTIKELLHDSKVDCDSSFHSSFKYFVNIISQFDLRNDIDKLYSWYDKSIIKARSLTKLFLSSADKITLSIVKNNYNYIFAHYNSADLPMLEDFVEIKDKLSIVNKSFVTFGKPLKFNEINVYLRDTVLLAPVGKASLAELGKLYQLEGDFSKIIVSDEDKSQMSKFLQRNKQAFEESAIREAIITLKHALSMERFILTIQKLGIPPYTLINRAKLLF